jgi:hypothetical protein
MANPVEGVKVSVAMRDCVFPTVGAKESGIEELHGEAVEHGAGPVKWHIQTQQACVRVGIRLESRGKVAKKRWVCAQQDGATERTTPGKAVYPSHRVFVISVTAFDSFERIV